MLEMLKARKEQLEAQGEKGFTLMEMLIVIAIIAVLVAIAIPVLSAQLENARDATTAANLRSAYAEASAAVLDSTIATGNDNITVAAGTGDVATVVTIKDVHIESSDADYGSYDDDLPFTFSGTLASEGDHDVTFSFNKNGTVTAAFA